MEKQLAKELKIATEYYLFWMHKPASEQRLVNLKVWSKEIDMLISKNK